MFFSVVGAKARKGRKDHRLPTENDSANFKCIWGMGSCFCCLPILFTVTVAGLVSAVAMGWART